MHVNEIAASLDAQFAGDQLADSAHRFFAADEFNDAPSAVFLLATACEQLASEWDGPVSVERSAQLKSKFMPLMGAVVSAIHERDTVRTHAATDRLARALNDSY